MNHKFFDLKREKQDRIINAALKIFAKNGYRHASTDDVVREAQISKGLLFHYFISKVGLYVFLMDYSVRFMMMELGRVVKTDETDFFQIRKQIEQGKLQVLRNYPYMQAFLNRAFKEQCIEALEETQLQKDAYEKKMESYKAQAAEMRLPIGVTAEQIDAMIEYVAKGIEEELIEGNRFQPEMLMEQVLGYMDALKGLCERR
ncbi:MAG: TetR/AcrR family transcriptional regulator [Lachnospiraceae bacterium]|nr:TetR/AcrR family transcriptional regulator [Lachnospiraceae bacterium]